MSDPLAWYDRNPYSDQLFWTLCGSVLVLLLVLAIGEWRSRRDASHRRHREPPEHTT